MNKKILLTVAIILIFAIPVFAEEVVEDKVDSEGNPIIGSFEAEIDREGNPVFGDAGVTEHPLSTEYPETAPPEIDWSGLPDKAEEIRLSLSQKLKLLVIIIVFLGSIVVLTIIVRRLLKDKALLKILLSELKIYTYLFLFTAPFSWFAVAVLDVFSRLSSQYGRWHFDTSDWFPFNIFIALSFWLYLKKIRPFFSKR